jgi:hypothetical protein
MAAPFGFLAGDLVAGLHLLHKAVVAVRGSDGAGAHFQSTVLELKGLEFELKGLEFTLQQVQGLQLASAAPLVGTKLRFLGHQCHMPINMFLARIGKFITELREQAHLKERIVLRSTQGDLSCKVSGLSSSRSTWPS